MSDIWSNAVQAHQEGNFRLAKQLYDQVLEDAKQAQDFEAFSIVCIIWRGWLWIMIKKVQRLPCIDSKTLEKPRTNRRQCWYF